ncbi:MAG: acyl-CoA dehydrogenase, partial [Planctomycetota bacterium]
MTILILLALLGVSLALLYLGRGYLAWVIPGAGALLALALRGAIGWPTFNTVGLIFAAVALLFGLPPLRRLFVGRIAMGALSRALPGMSETERVALEAGTVWWDAELFSGNPSWQRLLDLPSHSLTEEEQAFLDGPVEELCSMIDDWKARNRGDLPPEAWEFVKRHRFFGMIIPKEYGGLGFSALAHSQVVTKVSSRSVAAAVTVMVPNSLGPAELILHYGTDEQKRSYLPDLARGDEIPCFALTEPGAGSDAASMQSEGVVCKGTWEGEEVIGIRLNWNKRYITLVSVATVLGLAFRLRDPDHLLGEADDLGITCALVPTDLTGVDAARRHDPLGVPFINGPTTGRNVFVPIDSIIGGREMAGKGWLMLMQCLASGRGISLPALAGGAAQLATRTTSAYAGVRQQFNVKIGAFEGIEERLARIGGYTYMMNAARRMTAGAVDSGEKPAVISAIVKAYMTEMMRTVINDAMDVQAGAAISRGPRNVLSGAYESLPIGITVEGANILTRSLIIYGQGAMRCHPFLREQMEAIADRDLKRFDRAFFRHMGFVFSNGARSLLLGLTGGALANPPVGGD